MAIDPVCGMEVEIETAQWTFEYQGKRYYFCDSGCMESFSRDPEKYLAHPKNHSMGGHHGH